MNQTNLITTRRDSKREKLSRALRVLAVALMASLILLALSALHQSQVAAAPLAASQGPKYAGTASNTTWTNPSNATGANNGTCADNLALGGAAIDLTNFSFSVPAWSAITGILVEPKAGETSDVSGLSARLLKAGTPVGTTKAWVPPTIATSLPCSETTFASLGGAGDTWGASPTWTPSDVNASNFGVRIMCSNSADCGDGNDAGVLDAVSITVFFDLATPTPAPVNVPEADTLLLMSGGLGGLATWVGWQFRKRRGKK